MKRLASISTLILLGATLMARGESISTSVSHDALPASKQTEAGKYVTSEEAYRVLSAGKDHVMLIDVRTVQEYMFIGHAPMAYNVPFLFATRQWVPEAGRYALKPNEDFVEQVKRIADPEDTLLVTCRSGQRSAPASDALTEAGFENVYSVVDGFEGDKLKNEDSIYNGQRHKNGWRFAGLPWTYKLDPEFAYTEAE